MTINTIEKKIATLQAAKHVIDALNQYTRYQMTYNPDTKEYTEPEEGDYNYAEYMGALEFRKALNALIEKL